MADVRILNTQLRQIVEQDGAWLRCKACADAGNPDGAYWGAFRTDEFIAARWNRHADKAHKAQADQPAALPRARAPRNPAPKAQPNTNDVLAAVQDPEALLDQAIRDLNIGLAA